MLQKLGMGIAGLAWFAVVFVVSLWMTFPEQAAIDRARYEVQKATDGSINIDADGLSPVLTGVGAKVSNLSVQQIDKRKVERGDNDGAVATLFTADDAWVKVGVLSLLGSAPRAWGGVNFGDGALDFDVTGRAREKRGGYGVGEIKLEADNFPISSLPPINGATLMGTGSLDLDVDIDASEGMRKADGEATLFGNDIRITQISAPGTMLGDSFDMVTEVSELELKLAINSGKAKVKRGRLSSNLMDAEITGEIRLLEDLGRSTLKLDAVLDLGDDLQMFKNFLKDALHNSDKKHHYTISGTLSSPRIRPDREKRARPTRSTPRRNNARNKPDDEQDDEADDDKPNRRNGTPRPLAQRVDSRGLPDGNNVRALPRPIRPGDEDYADDEDEFDDDELEDGEIDDEVLDSDDPDQADDALDEGGGY